MLPLRKNNPTMIVKKKNIPLMTSKNIPMALSVTYENKMLFTEILYLLDDLFYEIDIIFIEFACIYRLLCSFVKQTGNL